MRIAQILEASPWGDCTPETLETQGMGGRETALVKLSEAWKDQGHEVLSFVPVKSRNKGGYIDIIHAMSFLSNMEFDVVVGWETFNPFTVEDIRENTKLKVIEMQVSQLDIYDKRNGENLDKYVDRYAVLSRWAGDYLSSTEPDLSRDKLRVFPNGVDLDRYRPLRKIKHPGKPPYKFFYSSSPDRGLWHLLNAWPEILKLYPGSELFIAYGIENWLSHAIWSHNVYSECALDIMENLTLPGVNYLGKIGQRELAKRQMECDALLYPCDPASPTETGCITIIEAGAAGCPVITTDADCLGSEFNETAEMIELPYVQENYIQAIRNVMEDPDRYVELQHKGLDLAESRSWDLIASNWLEFFENETANS